MSHLQTASRLKTQCVSNNNSCEEYQAFIQSKGQQYDTASNHQIKTHVSTGIILALIILALMAVPLIDPLKKFLAKLFSFVVVIAPVLGIGLVAAIVGFVISFSACFKQQCGGFESTAIFVLPLLSLVVSIPIAFAVSRGRRNVEARFYSISKSMWMRICLVLLAIVIIAVFSAIRSERQSNQQHKDQLINYQGSATE